MEELYHYGVVGMKRGVRRGNASKHFSKASKKVDKLKNRAAKANLKSASLRRLALKKEARAFTSAQYEKARKIERNAASLQLKSAKLERRAMRWEKNMEKVFREIKVSDIKAEDLETGKKYAYMLLKD